MAAFFESLAYILDFVARAFLHILPYLALSVPLAVWLKRSGLSSRIEGLLRGRAVTAVVAATLIGAVSPFCSCGVVPIVAALLAGGLPLAPVMSFWLASPSMDPEIFFLSVGTLGWKLAAWRLGATFAMSLGAGLAMIWIERRGLLGGQPLRGAAAAPALALAQAARRGPAPALAPARLSPGCSCQAAADPAPAAVTLAPACGCAASPAAAAPSRRALDLRGLAADSWEVLSRIALFMALAFVLEAVIERWVPQDLVAGLLGSESPFAVPLATLVGIPFYTTELSALGIVSGLMSRGMSGAAALAFLVGGGVTTLPAMAAVWGLVKPRVFALYLGFCVAGSLLSGYAFQLATALGL